MPVERVKITSDNITLKNSSGNVVFNTDYKYIKTDVTGNLAYSVVTPSINVYFVGSSSGLTMPLSEAINKHTGVVFHTITGNVSLWNYPEDLYIVYKIPANGNLISHTNPPLLLTGVVGGSPSFEEIYPLYEVYANTRFLGYFCITYLGVVANGYPAIHSSGSTGFSVVGSMRSAITTDNTYLIRSMPVYKNETIRFYRASAHVSPLSQFTWARPTYGSTASSFLYNSGMDIIPLKVTV